MSVLTDRSLNRTAAVYCPRVKFWLLVATGLLLLATTCCDQRTETDSNEMMGRSVIAVWAHHGKPEEWETIQEQVKRFNEKSVHNYTCGRITDSWLRTVTLPMPSTL